MSGRVAAPAPRQSASANDKEVNVQVLLRCRCGAERALRGAANGKARPSPLQAERRLTARRQCCPRRPQSAEEIKQRIPQVIKCNDALREVRRRGAENAGSRV